MRRAAHNSKHARRGRSSVGAHLTAGEANHPRSARRASSSAISQAHVHDHFRGVSVAACVLGPLYSSHPARAETSPQTQETASSDHGTDENASHRTRFGATAGIGFPRHALCSRPWLKVGGLLGVGVEYGLLPSGSWAIDDVTTRISGRSRATQRLPVPERAFFVGLRAGRQQRRSRDDGHDSVRRHGRRGARARFVVSQSAHRRPLDGEHRAHGRHGGSAFRFRSRRASRARLPLALVPDAERTVSTLGKTVLPTIDLLQIGVLFP